MDTSTLAPIVLAHGLFGFTKIQLGPLTVATYFRGVPEFLRAHGRRVYVPRVHPTAGAARRARKLAERIDGVFPGERVHLIGHSMGGRDARELVNLPGWEDRVLSLTTIGTPHLGSPLAEHAQRKLGPVYEVLRALDWDHEGFLELLPDRAMRWHEETAVPDHIPCHHVAGITPPDDVCRVLRRTHALLLREIGPNDGLVPARSAAAFGHELTSTPVDHLRQMNWYSGQRGNALGPNVQAIYRSILQGIVESEREAALGVRT